MMEKPILSAEDVRLALGYGPDKLTAVALNLMVEENGVSRKLCFSPMPYVIYLDFSYQQVVEYLQEEFLGKNRVVFVKKIIDIAPLA